jgi:hypothetical protein
MLCMSAHLAICLVDDETLSGGSACRWYLNEDIPEIDSYFERWCKVSAYLS